MTQSRSEISALPEVRWKRILQYFSRSVAHTAFHEMLSQKKLADEVGFHYALQPETICAYRRGRLWHRQDGAHLDICGPRPFKASTLQCAVALQGALLVHGDVR